MGLTYQSCGIHTCYGDFGLNPLPGQLVVALAGNPNTGKSTVFNALTGLKQHTGNWPGKTVLRAEGTFSHRNKKVLLVDLPGAYSLLAKSADEQVARDFICFGRPHAITVVVDATCLERNLNLVLQVMEISPKVVVCVNLIDEARRRKIKVDTESLARELGVPCIPTTARDGIGLDQLKDAIIDVATEVITTSPRSVTYEPQVEQAVAELEVKLRPLLPSWINHRWVALRILEEDYSIIKAICSHTYEESAGIVVREGAAAWAR
jgi:Fe2+ transport system protein B